MLWLFSSLLLEHEVTACFMLHHEDDGVMKKSVLCCKMELGWVVLERSMVEIYTPAVEDCSHLAA